MHNVSKSSKCSFILAPIFVTLARIEISLLNVETRSLKNVLKIALLNTVFFGFLQASSALAVEQKAYLATEAGETEIQFPAEAESVVVGLYYQPAPEETTTGVGVVVNFDHTVLDASFENLAANAFTSGATGDGEFRASYLSFGVALMTAPSTLSCWENLRSQEQSVRQRLKAIRT